MIRAADKPVYVPPELDRDGIEEYRLRMEEILESLTRDTDERFEQVYAAARPARQLPPFESQPLTPALAEQLRDLHATLARTSICGLGQVALAPLLSIVDRFPVSDDARG